MESGMHLIIGGSGDAAGIPVDGCHCALCRQARAVRHLRRNPTSLLVQDGADRLLILAGSPDRTRRDWQDPPQAVLLCDWQIPHWAGLIGVHLGAGPETPVLGPATDGTSWLQSAPGRLSVRDCLRDGVPVPVGRFQVHAFALPEQAPSVALGLTCGEQRLLYLPWLDTIDKGLITRLRDWKPQAVVMDCPGSGRAEARVHHLLDWQAQLAHPAILLTGIDHHLDRWLQRHGDTLPPDVRVAHDEQRVELAYLREHRRLAQAAY